MRGLRLDLGVRREDHLGADGKGAGFIGNWECCVEVEPVDGFLGVTGMERSMKDKVRAIEVELDLG